MDSIQVGAADALEEQAQMIHRAFTSESGEKALEYLETYYLNRSVFSTDPLVMARMAGQAELVLAIKRCIELVESPEKFNIEVETEESNGMEELIDSPDLFSGDDVNG